MKTPETTTESWKKTSNPGKNRWHANNMAKSRNDSAESHNEINTDLYKN
jgi:hypothetical protein